MIRCIFGCAAALMVTPASAIDTQIRVDLLAGHPIYHEDTQEAGIVMGLSIAASQGNSAPLTQLCRKLQVAAGLPGEIARDLKLEVLFVVPYKEMAIEGLYLPADGHLGTNALMEGKGLDRPTLNDIILRAHVPPGVLDETNVKLEVSCQLDEPLWTISWQDIRPIGGQEPKEVIERARLRFMAVYRSVAKHAGAV